MKEVILQLLQPHPGQLRVLSSSHRFNVVACGRRWGKTLCGQHLIVQAALRAQPCGWFSPTYRMLAEVWRDLKRVLQPLCRSISEQEHRIELINGGTIDFWSLDSGDTTRGRAYGRCIIDEAALAKNVQDAWHAAIRPTLTDLRGDGWFLSTPQGLDGFHALFQLGADGANPDWGAYQAPTAENPFILAEEIAAARQDLPERIFAQEYLAEFIGEGIGVFRHVGEATTSVPVWQAQTGHRYVMGVDWGKHEDFTVISVLDIGERRQVWQERFNQLDYHLQIGRLRVLCERFKPQLVVAEKNAVGEPILEQAIRMRIPVWPFTTHVQSKNLVVEALSLAFERRQLRILPDKVQLHELRQFTTERLPSGLLRYTAPAGMHDDCVIALALSWLAACQPSGQIVQRDFRVVA